MHQYLKRCVAKCRVLLRPVIGRLGHLSKQLAKINNSSLTTTHSARNLGFIFDEHLTFSDQILSVSKCCYYHIRQLRCIRPYLDAKTASTIKMAAVRHLGFVKFEILNGRSG